MQISQAYQYCRDVANDHYENFPVASLLIPKQIRNAIFAIYAFARKADDYADESTDIIIAREKLDGWRAFLQQTEKGNPPDIAEFIALADVLGHTAISSQYLHDLLDAFIQDTEINRYENWNALLSYCQKSANPVGRLLLQLFNRHEPELIEKSDAICTGLQLINFWQDLSIDIPRHRLYIPEEMLTIEISDIKKDMAGLNDEERNGVIDSLSSRTWEIFERGRDLYKVLPGRIGIEIKLTYLGGKAILNKINRYKGGVFVNRPAITGTDKARILMTAVTS